MAGPELPVLRGKRVVLRPVRDDDLAPLLAMLSEPELACWFGSWDAARVRRDLLAPQDDEVVLAIEVEGEVAGVLMVGEEEEPDYRCVSIDPEADNDRAIRALSRPAASPPLRAAAVGFRPVGVMRRYERALDGTWRDGLLMDLLAEEYRAL
jgi:aminoglycoside 6'-N-acetyltransferase